MERRGEWLKHCMEISMSGEIKDKIGFKEERLLNLDVTQLVMRMLWALKQGFGC